VFARERSPVPLSVSTCRRCVFVCRQCTLRQADLAALKQCEEKLHRANSRHREQMDKMVADATRQAQDAASVHKQQASQLYMLKAMLVEATDEVQAWRDGKMRLGNSKAWSGGVNRGSGNGGGGGGSSGRQQNKRQTAALESSVFSFRSKEDDDRASTPST